MADWQIVEQLARERGTALKRYAFLLSGVESEADDMVQDAFERLSTRSLRGTGQLGVAEGYVKKVILNAYIDRPRRHARWLRIWPSLLAAPATEPEVGTDHQIDIARALARLSPRQRACVVLRYYQDEPIDEIARQLSCKSGTIKRHLSDGLSRLSDVLDSYGMQGDHHGTG